MIPRAMIWANYRRNHVGMDTIAVPAPVDGGPNVPWWYDKIAMLASLRWQRFSGAISGQHSAVSRTVC